MIKIIDLSQKLLDKMPVHPLDEEAIIVQNKSVEENGYSDTRISLGMHTGTHIDTPAHIIKGGRGIEGFDLSYFYGKACVLDVSGEKEIILTEARRNKIAGCDVVLLYTGWGNCFGEEKYYSDSAPVISNIFAEYLAKKISGWWAWICRLLISILLKFTKHF